MIDKKEMLEIFVDANMTQKKLAKLLGKSPTTINKWLNNKSFPSTQEVNEICRVLEITDDKMKAKIFLN